MLGSAFSAYCPRRILIHLPSRNERTISSCEQPLARAWLRLNTPPCRVAISLSRPRIPQASTNRMPQTPPQPQSVDNSVRGVIPAI